jgi:hypothetical protein
VKQFLAETHWAPRVPPWKIQKLYNSDREGMLDTELLQQVGLALLARCQDILEVSDALAGKVHCRRCGTILPRTRLNSPLEDEEVLHCPGCGWEITWRDFFESITVRKLRGGEVVPIYQAFISGWKRAKTAEEKMLTIDHLIHEFHTYLGEATKPVAVTVIAGNSTQTAQLIETLAYDPGRRQG